MNKKMLRKNVICMILFLVFFPIFSQEIAPRSGYADNHDNTQYDMESFYYNMCIQMIMQVLGERTMANRISTVELISVNLLMPAVPLSELPNYIY